MLWFPECQLACSQLEAASATNRACRSAYLEPCPRAHSRTVRRFVRTAPSVPIAPALVDRSVALTAPSAGGCCELGRSSSACRALAVSSSIVSEPVVILRHGLRTARCTKLSSDRYRYSIDARHGV